MELNKKVLNKFIDQRYSHINIGSGEEISIKDLTKITNVFLSN